MAAGPDSGAVQPTGLLPEVQGGNRQMIYDLDLRRESALLAKASALLVRSTALLREFEALVALRRFA